MLTPPPYFSVADLQAQPITHTWDDWDPYPDLGDPDDALIEAARGISGLAREAFAIACAEWVIFRLGALTADRLPLAYIEASWARLINWQGASIWEPDIDHYLGPILGPQGLAAVTITNCHNALPLHDGAVDAAFAARIPRHVLPDPTPFLAWQEQAMARLHHLYPQVDADFLGPPVPRQALDPALPVAELTAGSCAMLLNAFVRDLDFAANAFLDANSFLGVPNQP